MRKEFIRSVTIVEHPLKREDTIFVDSNVKKKKKKLFQLGKVARGFPKAKYSVVGSEFPVGSKFDFFQ